MSEVQESIDKGAVRVGKMMKDKVAGGKVMEIRVWFHEDCFLEAADTTDDEKQLVRRKAGELRGEEVGHGDEEEMDMVGYLESRFLLIRRANLFFLL